MIPLIQKKRPVKEGPHWDPSGQNGWVERLAKRVIEWQHCLSMRLQKASEVLSVPGKKASLVLLCIIGAGCSLWIAAGAVFSHAEPGSYKWIPIKTVLLKAGDSSFPAKAITQDSLFRRIEDFKKYMDSLEGTVTGRERRDSLLSTRPGLMDSISQLEKMYQVN